MKGEEDKHAKNQQMLWLEQGEQHKKIERLTKTLFASTWFASMVREVGEFFHYNVQTSLQVTLYFGYIVVNIDNTLMVVLQETREVKK